MNHFYIKDNRLYAENFLVEDLAKEFGTPLYIYSKNQILKNYREINQPLVNSKLDFINCYAIKANSNPEILKLLAEEGAGAEIASGGELYLAHKFGYLRNKITFTGVGKTDEEIEYALKENIFNFTVESMQEVKVISEIAHKLGVIARVSIRVNPDIDAKTHPYITTGMKENKFGIDSKDIIEVFKTALKMPNIDVIGIHSHIGSQITDVDPYIEAVKYLGDLIKKVEAMGVNIRYLNFGGGFGVRYKNVLTHRYIPFEEDEIKEYASLGDHIESVIKLLSVYNKKLVIEPGRSLVANAGILAGKVLFIKQGEVKKFVITDTGMNDLMRPCLYQAYHQLVPLNLKDTGTETVDIVGPVCETSDFLAAKRCIQRLERGDRFAVMTTGAYGYSLSSNYNARLRPAEVLVDGDKYRLIREREKVEELHY
ncbi:MAG: diaminopimelate decarboxylase [Chlorobi bacterium]|nr:diaminopimelate decarboxylase [Chlorobiota bacterium]MCI0716717.1 diaminopimelate decarboxylase [Chlorobiota bacterium]